MMEAIGLVLFLVVAGVLIVQLFSSSTDEKVPEPCKIHNWVLDQNEKLMCMECGFRPEEHQ